jgi:DNA-binding transcriptional ArsR family regulator
LVPELAAVKVGAGKKGLGVTLQSVIEREKKIAEEEGRRKTRETTLMNPVRRKVFELVCRRPCVTFSGCARLSGLTINNLKWHLMKLADSGYVTVEKRRGASIVYPNELLEPALKEAFAALEERGGREIFREIAENRGISMGELVSTTSLDRRIVQKAVSRLEDRGIISRIRDGRFTRYYATKNYDDLRLGSARKLRSFRAHIVRKLAQEGMQPEVIRGDSDALVVHIRAGKERTVLNIHTGF